MKLSEILNVMADMVDLEIVVDDCGNVAGTYTSANDIAVYHDCDVETIDTTENGMLIVSVNGNTPEE